MWRHHRWLPRGTREAQPSSTPTGPDLTGWHPPLSSRAQTVNQRECWLQLPPYPFPTPAPCPSLLPSPPPCVRRAVPGSAACSRARPAGSARAPPYHLSEHRQITACAQSPPTAKVNKYQLRRPNGHSEPSYAPDTAPGTGRGFTINASRRGLHGPAVSPGARAGTHTNLPRTRSRSQHSLPRQENEPACPPTRLRQPIGGPCGRTVGGRGTAGGGVGGTA